MSSILEQPKKTFEEFCLWFKEEPIWHKMQIENVTCRDKGQVKKGLISNKATIHDIYNIWYLPRLLTNN